MEETLENIASIVVVIGALAFFVAIYIAETSPQTPQERRRRERQDARDVLAIIGLENHPLDESLPDEGKELLHMACLDDVLKPPRVNEELLETRAVEYIVKNDNISQEGKEAILRAMGYGRQKPSPPVTFEEEEEDEYYRDRHDYDRYDYDCYDIPQEYRDAAAKAFREPSEEEETPPPVMRPDYMFPPE